MNKRCVRRTAGSLFLLLALSCLWLPAVSARAEYDPMTIHHTCRECNQYFGENYLLCHETMGHEFKIQVPQGYTAGEISWKVTKKWIPDSLNPASSQEQKEQTVAEGTGDTIRLVVNEEDWWNYTISASILKNRMPVEESRLTYFRTVQAIYTDPAGPNTTGVTLNARVGETVDLAQVQVRRFTRDNIASGGELVTLGSVANGLKIYSASDTSAVSFSGTPATHENLTVYPGLAVTGKAEGSYHPRFLFGKTYYDAGFEDLTTIDVVFAGKAAGSEVKETEKTPETTAAAVSVPAVKGLKAKAGKKKATITWKAAAKKAKVTGYEVSYRLQGAQKWTVKKLSASKKKLVVKKLKKKKKYEFRIRAIKKVGKKTYYGAYTAAKPVKIK